jgi:beta-aspartyl-peptidase (threonine type)
MGMGRDPMAAAQAAIAVLARRVNGLGGCILLDAHGRVGFAFNTPHMAYAYRMADGHEVVGI